VVKSPALAGAESGQATLEYILLIAVVVSTFVVMMRGLERFGLGEKMLKPIREDFAYAYKYGHPQARGYDEGEPRLHPRIEVQGSFRIFINPQVRR
jgi:hypothetical protein